MPDLQPPKIDCSIFAAAPQPFPVRTEGDGANIVRMPGKSLLERPVPDPPEPDGRALFTVRIVAGDLFPQRAQSALLAAAARQPLAVGAEGHGVDVLRAAGERP